MGEIGIVCAGGDLVIVEFTLLPFATIDVLKDFGSFSLFLLSKSIPIQVYPIHMRQFRSVPFPYIPRALHRSASVVSRKTACLGEGLPMSLVCGVLGDPRNVGK